MPKWLPALLVASLLVLLGFAAQPILLPATNPRITRENFERIEEGMRREDVEAILGPPGDYRTGPTYNPESFSIASFGSWGPRGTMLAWEGDKGGIEVWVDPGGVVFESSFTPMAPEPVGLFDLLRWRWDRWRESRR
jgi:hypothetical protein